MVNFHRLVSQLTSVVCQGEYDVSLPVVRVVVLGGSHATLKDPTTLLEIAPTMLRH